MVAICIACAVIWFIKDDIRFALYVKNMSKSTEVAGVILNMQKKGGKYRTDYQVEFTTPDKECSGMGSVSQERFGELQTGGPVRVLLSDSGCALKDDLRFYSPPRMVYIKIGLFLLLALAALLSARWKKE